MDEKESRERAAVVAEARTWLGTRYHDKAKIKGAGADCLTFIVGVGEAVGLVGDITLPFYSRQFGLHRSEQTYLDGLREYTREVETPLPGDIVLWVFGRVYSHAAIVLEWPVIIHADTTRGVVIDDADRCRWLSFIGKGEKVEPRPRKFLSYWGR